MNHLSLEDCQWLKEAGFPQGDTYFIYAIGNVSKTPTLFSRNIYNPEEHEIEWYACPSLEELWDGAESMIRDYRGSGAFSHIGIRPTSPSLDEYAAIEVWRPPMTDSYTFAGKANGKKEAIVNLLRVILEKTNGTTFRAVLQPPKKDSI